MAIEPFNWYGTYTLSVREILRPLKVVQQTLIGPAVSALLYLTIFVLSIGNSHQEIEGIKYINFIGYGLIIMSMVQNSFANTSSSLIFSKVIGNIIDILMAPLGGAEIVTAMCIGGVLRGVTVGILVGVALTPFVDFVIYHPIFLLFITFNSCLFLSLLGILSSLVSNNFEQNASVTNYIIAPLCLLSGTFYPINALPKVFQVVNYINPFYYIIDGFRHCFTNLGQSNLYVGAIFLITLNIGLFCTLSILIDKGWKLKT